MLFSKVQPVRVIVMNVPQTSTMLAFGFFTAVFLWGPFLVYSGAQQLPAELRDEVISNGKFMRDAMLLILGYYFAKVVNTGQEQMVNKTLDIAAASSATTPQSAQDAADQVAGAAEREAGRITGGN